MNSRLELTELYGLPVTSRDSLTLFETGKVEPAVTWRSFQILMSIVRLDDIWSWRVVTMIWDWKPWGWKLWQLSFVRSWRKGWSQQLSESSVRGNFCDDDGRDLKPRQSENVWQEIGGFLRITVVWISQFLPESRRMTTVFDDQWLDCLATLS